MEKESFKSSISEERGINLITKNDKNILSIGISTAGRAEIEMARKNPDSNIIATTIDENGLEYTKKIVEEEGFDQIITLKKEDISEKMPYPNNYFDYIYARLVLHYLNDKQLENALAEIYRVLKTNGKFFVVVRSLDEWEAKLEGTTFNPETGFTSYPNVRAIKNNEVKYISRRLHSKESISKFLRNANFKINYVKEYEEYLYRDFNRTIENLKPNKIIEVLANKS